MEPRKTTQTDEPANGTSPENTNEAADKDAATGAAPDVDARTEQYAKEATAAYERARREMNDAVGRLKTEIENLEMDRAALRAQQWIRENSALATVLALGGGILVGRLIASTLTPAPPPPLPVRLRNRALEASRHAGHYAEDLGRAVKKGAATAAGAAAVAGGTLAHEAGEAREVVADRARYFGEAVGHRVGPYADALSHRFGSLGEQASHRTSAWSDVAGDRAHHALAAFQDATEDVTDVLQKKASEGIDLAGAAFNTMKAVTAAVLVSKINNLVRRVF